MTPPSNGGIQSKKFISEGNIYRLITKSKLPEAEKFESWIFDDVIPTVVKHGIYATDAVLEKTLQDPDYMIGLLTQLKQEREEKKELELQKSMLEQQVLEYEPKATYYDEILKSKNLISITQIAKDYDLTSGQALNKILHEEKVQYKQGKQWFLYSHHNGKGYTKSDTYKDDWGNTRMNTKWTQKGRLFIHGILQKRGIVPNIEKEAN